MRTLPRYALAGLILTCASEVLMLLEVEPFWTWHTSIAWTGYVLFVDGVVWMRRGHSWVRDSPRELAFLAILSIPLWLVFEFYNLFIRNWHYIHLPEQPALRALGFAWSFATIWPAILITGEMIGSLRIPSSASPLIAETQPEALGLERGNDDASKIRSVSDGSAWEWGPTRILMMVLGAAFLIWPFIQPSAYLAAPVWLGFVLLVDPINARWGEASLLVDVCRGRHDRAINLALSGLLCGVLWEFWNYWARAKWIYTVPIMEEVRIFEMPLAGYLGFPAFALECFTMYVFVRRLLWNGAKRTIAL
ncbi:MAG: hypothetical protein HYS05_07955 [Acidobacteria bacterium]|nr:hypothetical protein [Acidobacteriota bacterium]